MTPTPALSRDEEMLAEIAERDFALACRAHDEAMAAERDQLPALSRAYQKATRSLRQTLALKAKLTRAQDETARKAKARAETERAGRIHDRKEQIRLPLERAIWDEAEDDDSAEREVVRLDDLVEVAARAEGFLDEPVEQLITRIAHALGYAVEITPGRAAPSIAPAAQPARAADTS